MNKTLDETTNDRNEKDIEPIALMAGSISAKRKKKPRGRRNPNVKLSENFRSGEFWCNDGTPYRQGRGETYRYICETFLEPMRRRFGACTVTSAYRTKAYNAKVGGASASIHVNELHDKDDVAVDVFFAKGTPAEWAQMARSIRTKTRGGRGGVGRYDESGFVHIDTRDYKADWSG